MTPEAEVLAILIVLWKMPYFFKNRLQLPRQWRVCKIRVAESWSLKSMTFPLPYSRQQVRVTRFFEWDHKNGRPVCDTLMPYCSMVMNAELRSPQVWKILERDYKQQNKLTIICSLVLDTERTKWVMVTMCK